MIFQLFLRYEYYSGSIITLSYINYSTIVLEKNMLSCNSFNTNL